MNCFTVAAQLSNDTQSQQIFIFNQLEITQNQTNFSDAAVRYGSDQPSLLIFDTVFQLESTENLLRIDSLSKKICQIFSGFRFSNMIPLQIEYFFWDNLYV